MDPTKLTFDALEKFQKRRVASGDGPSASSLPNLMSALKALIQQNNLTGASPVGSHLRASFYKRLRAHTAALIAEGRTKAYVSNRKILLGQWRSCVIAYDHLYSSLTKQPHPYQAAIKDIFDSGITQKGLARSCNIPLATLRRWLGGALPKGSSLSHVPRLERHLGLEAGALTSLIPNAGATRSMETSKNRQIPYRERLASALKSPYAVKDPIKRLRDEWKGFFEHKVGVLTSVQLHSDDDTEHVESGLKRSTNGRWRIKEKPNAPQSWYATHDGQYCPTASMQWSMVAQFTGWLMLDKSLGGMAMSAEEAQTLANFARRTLVEPYIAWRVARADGHVHSGIEGFLMMVCAMCNPRTGYLTQCGHLFAELAGFDRDEAWRKRCENAYTAAKDLRAVMASRASPSRNPQDPVRDALDLENPLEAIASMVTRMTAARPYCTGVKEAIWARDKLLVKLLASNPLRIGNYRDMTYRQDNSGHLRQDPSGAWFIFVPRNQLKNHRGAAAERDYYMPVRQEVWIDIDDYLNQYRPILLKKSSDNVFISSSEGGAFSEESLGRRFEALTKRHLAGCPGVGPHAMRHIFATSILKAAPNDWVTAAWALHDKEETVRRNYAHLAQADAQRWLDKSLSGPFSRMQ